MGETTALLLVVLAFVVVGHAVVIPTLPPTPSPPSSSTYSSTFTFGGSPPFCAQCGANGAFACSDQSNWNDGTFFFTDQTPDGNIPVSVQIDILGSFACEDSDPDDIGAYVNGFLIDIDSVIQSGDFCACDTCDGQVSFSSTQQHGLPIIKGGNNTLKIENFYNTICLNTVTLTVTYEVNDAQLEVFTKQTSYYRGATSSFHVESCGETYSRTIRPPPSGYDVATFQFADPLPNDYLLFAANFRIYGRFWYNEGNCTDQAALNVTLGSVDTLIKSQTKPTTLTAPENPDSCLSTGCDHGWQFDSETLYQDGWPGYESGHYNYIYVGNMGEGTVQISRVDFIAFGYPQP